MSYRFEKLNVWIETRLLIKDIYLICNKFPRSELYCLGDQIKRAAISIALNIAEGSDKKSDKDFIRFLRISLGSINEVVTALYIALDLKFINQKDFDILYEKSNKISKMTNGLIRSLNEKN